MPKIIDLTGQRFHKLVAVRKVGVRESRSGGTVWEFLCDCGTSAVKLGTDVTRSRDPIKSCGCEVRVGRSWGEKHGHASVGGTNRATPTYMAWRSARNRCRNPRNEAFKNYGARGISFSARWDEFPVFLADLGECPPGLTLERIDVNLGYEPGNCRWATTHDQVRNTRHNVFVEHGGARIILKDYAAARGVGYTALIARMKRGQDPHAAADALIEYRARRQRGVDPTSSAPT